MRERFAKKREPVWWDWAERSMRGKWCMGGHDGIHGDGLREMKGQWFHTQEEEEGVMKSAVGDLTCCDETFLLQCGFCPWVYTDVCSRCSALSQSRTANAASSVPLRQTFNAHTHVQTQTHTHTQWEKHTKLSSPCCHTAYICLYNRTFTALKPVCYRNMLN